MAEKRHEFTAASPIPASVQYKSLLPPDPAEMVHELASPFSAITLQLETLEQELKCCEQCHTYIPEQLEPTITQLRSVHHLMKTYLHQEVKETGQCNVHQLVKSIVLLLRPTAQQNNVEIVYDRKFALWWPTHPYQIRQLLLNVLNNSLQAYSVRTVEDQTLSIRRILIKTSIQRDSLHIMIQDWAGGFSSDRVPSNLAPKGHGIGLKQIHHYAEELGGEIAVVSKAPNGTIVTIKLRKEHEKYLGTLL